MTPVTSLLRSSLTAFITGAGSGIGQAITYAFARNGIRSFALCDISEPSLAKTVAELENLVPDGLKIEAIHMDAGKEADVVNAVQQTVEKLGSLDIAVNNAGVGGPLVGIAEYSAEDWRRVLDVNLDGVFFCQREQIKQMLTQQSPSQRLPRGTIINIASMYGISAPPASIPAPAYTASKHGVIGITRANAAYYSAPERNIKINALCPGYIRTQLSANSGISTKQPGDEKDIMALEEEKTPMQRQGHVNEIADVAVFLASEMSSFVSGAAIVADGGHTII